MFSKLMDVLNDLQPRQILMLAGSTALLIFVVVYLALSVLSEKDPVPVAPPATQVATRTVVVAKEDIPPHSILKEEMLEIKELPVTAVPKGTVMVMKDVLDQPTASTIYAGDVITISKVYMDKTRTGFVGSIPEGYRAVSVGVSNVTGVAGFAKPGDYVDVILVEKGKQGATSRFLLQNVLLLGVNQDMTTREESNKENSKEGTKDSKKKDVLPAVATLALDPDNALQLVSAASVGEIYLALRPFNAKDTYAGFGEYTVRSSMPAETVTIPREVAAQVAPAYEPSTAPAAPAPSSAFEIIQGDKVLGK